ncbi:MAG: phage tail protein [Bacillota bacterium]|nr:phage tail protein [Bacillota bacterium]
MTAFEAIVQAIEVFEYPYAPDIYTGNAKRYFTYNYADQRATEFADDKPLNLVASVQVHFFLPANENFIRIQREIQQALFEKGFTYPEITVRKEDKTRHIVFECEIEESEE